MHSEKSNKFTIRGEAARSFKDQLENLPPDYKEGAQRMVDGGIELLKRDQAAFEARLPR